MTTSATSPLTAPVLSIDAAREARRDAYLERMRRNAENIPFEAPWSWVQAPDPTDDPLVAEADRPALAQYFRDHGVRLLGPGVSASARRITDTWGFLAGPVVQYLEPALNHRAVYRKLAPGLLPAFARWIDAVLAADLPAVAKAAEECGFACGVLEGQEPVLWAEERYPAEWQERVHREKAKRRVKAAPPVAAND